ncbi:MAG: C40 family peptidase [Clostridiales bacterium]|nr:C40 family peptidase [Clostridiales bacterium]
MYKTAIKFMCGVISAVCTLGFLNIDERDPETEKINLQSPSLVYVSMAGRYANADVIAKQEEADRRAEEADTEEEADAYRIYNSEFFSLDNYTITAPANYEEIANNLRKDDPANNENKENYDGNSVWVKNPAKIYKEAATSSKTVAEIGKGTKMIRISYQGDWSYVRLATGVKGYIPSSLLSTAKVATPTPTPTATPKPKKKKPTATPKPKITSKSENKTVYASATTNTRSGPGISYSKVSTIKAGTAIKVVAKTSNGWYKSDKGWYVLSSLTTTKAPTTKKNTPTPTPKPKSSSSSSTTIKRGDKSGGFAKYIRSFVGCKYVSGGASPSGFDCSGFTMYCYKNYYNIKLPHGANMQTKYGTKVSFDSMQVGDIIYFDHDHNGKADHVGLYVGNGEMVHASGVKTGVKCVAVSKLKDVLMVRRIL